MQPADARPGAADLTAERPTTTTERSAPVESPGLPPAFPPAFAASVALLHHAVREVGEAPDLAAVEWLARWLAEQVRPGRDPDLRTELAAAADLSRRTGEGIVVAEADTGHVMVVRYFPPEVPTPIHGHGGWGAVVVLEGHGRYETWEPTADGYARVTDVCELRAGDTLGWPDPPHDVHRQEALSGGAVELTVFARHPFSTWAPHFQPAGDDDHEVTPAIPSRIAPVRNAENPDGYGTSGR